MPTVNEQGLTAAQMSQLTEDQMKERVLTESQQNPNELIVGGQLGALQTGTEKTPVTYQAYTSDPDLLASSMEGASSGVMTSAPAEAYVEGVQKELESKEEQLARMSNEAVRLRSADTQEKSDMIDYFNKYSGQSADPGVIPQGVETRIREVKKAFEVPKQVLSEQQTEEMATRRAAEFYGGRSGSAYTESAIGKVKRDQLRDTQALAEKEALALRGAWSSAMSGNIEASEQLRKEAKEAKREQIDTEAKYLDKIKKTYEVEKFAEERVGDTAKRMFESGYEPDDDQLLMLDDRYGLNDGTSKTIFEATKAVEGRKLAKEERDIYKDEIGIQKDLAALEDIPMNRQEKLLDIQAKIQASKTRAYDEMNKIFDTMKNVPSGMQVNIGDATYFGIEGNAVFEKDANDNGKLAYQDANGNIQVQNLGNFGKPEDMETVYVDGMQILRNKKTKQIIPASVGPYAQPGSQAWSEMYPDGSENPWRPASDPYRKECAGYLNSLYTDGKVWGNTLTEKLTQAKQYEVDKNDIQPDDSIVMSTNAKWGHVALVTEVFRDDNGETMVRLNESNFIPPGGGKISNSRTMSINDPRLKAVARIPLNPDRSPSNPTSSIESEYRGETSTVNPFITRGVAMSESQMQAATQKWEQTQTLAQDLADGTYTEHELFQGVPADVRNEARRQALTIKKDQESAEKERFMESFKSSFVGPVTQTQLDSEWKTYKQEIDKAKAIESGSPSSIAQNIMDGSSSLDVKSLPMEIKTQVDSELAKLKKQALENDDVVSYLRASSGGKEVAQATIDSFEKGANVLSQIGDLQAQVSGVSTGPIRGIISSRNPYDTKAREIQAKLTAIIPNLARGVYGEVGVLTDQDVKLYSRTLPNLTDTTAVNKAILSSTIKSVARSLERKLRTNAAAGRDVSGFIPQYLELKSESNRLLVEAAPQNFRVVNDALYSKEGDKWVLQK